MSIATRLLMLVGGVMMSLTLIALTPVLPRIEDELAQTPTDILLVKLLATITGVTMVIGALVAGYLLDRMRAPPVLIVAGLLYAVGGTAGFFLGTLELILVSRLFVGFAAAAIATTSMTLINGRLEGVERAKWMGWHVAAAVVASLLLHPVAGALGEIGWRWPFLLYGAGLLVVVLALLTNENLAADKSEEAAATALAPARPLTSWFPVRFILLAVGIGALTYIPTTYLPFVVREIGIDSPFITSLVGLGDASLTAIFAFLFSRFRARYPSQAMFAFSFGCAALGLGIVTVGMNFWVIVGGMMVFGLGLGWFVPNLMTAAAECVARYQQGRTVGIVKAAHYLAAPTCILAVEPLSQAFGPHAAMGVACALGLVLFTIFLRRSLQLFGRGRAATAQPAE